MHTASRNPNANPSPNLRFSELKIGTPLSGGNFQTNFGFPISTPFRFPVRTDGETDMQTDGRARRILWPFRMAAQ